MSILFKIDLRKNTKIGGQQFRDKSCVLMSSATLQHCNALQHTATRCTVLYALLQHGNTLQHTSACCNTRQHTATHSIRIDELCNTLQRIATLYTHCSTLQRPATHCNALQHTVPHCNTLQRTAPHYTALRRTVAHCNALQLTATRCSKP